jgi:hypothetical protein
VLELPCARAYVPAYCPDRSVLHARQFSSESRWDLNEADAGLSAGVARVHNPCMRAPWPKSHTEHNRNGSRACTKRAAQIGYTRDRRRLATIVIALTAVPSSTIALGSGTGAVVASGETTAPLIDPFN